MSFGKFTIGLEGGLSIGIPKSSSDDMSSEDMLLSEDKSVLGTGDCTGEELGVGLRDGGLGVGGGVEIRVLLTDDDGLGDGE